MGNYSAKLNERRKNKGLAASKTATPKMVKVGEYLNVAAEHADIYRDAIETLAWEAVKVEQPGLHPFTKEDAAIHEASHCVVCRGEGPSLKSASLWATGNGASVGEYLSNDETGFFKIDIMNWEKLLGRPSNQLPWPKRPTRPRIVTAEREKGWPVYPPHPNH